MTQPPFRLSMLLLASLFSSQLTAQTNTLPPDTNRILPFPPVLRIPEAKIPVRLEQVSLKTDISGSQAHSVIELSFYNPNERVLEGQLEFPLTQGQTVSGFALDIDGKLRQAVVVEKDRGQKIFEDLSRTRVDPALLEVTRGNQYRLRIYPLPAKAKRTVQLHIDQTLISNQTGQYSFRAPLQFGMLAGKLDARIQIEGINARQIQLRSVQNDIHKLDENSQSVISWQAKDVHPQNGILELLIPAKSEAVSSYTSFQNQQYFYAEVPVAPMKSPRPAPKKILILWDASGSGAQRQHEKEFAVLDQYLRQLGNVDVELKLLRDQAEDALQFQVRGGQWDGLRSTLQQVVYDGASNAAAYAIPAGSQLALLFSDGIMNWGKDSLRQVLGSARIPVYSIVASPLCDFPALRGIAETSGAQVLDLQQTSTSQAVLALNTQALRLHQIVSNSATQIVTASVYPEQGRWRIAGILSSPQADVRVEWQQPDGKRRSSVVKLDAAAKATNAGIAARRWAELQLAQLMQDSETQRAAIRRLGQQFNIPTAETSLIVLDTVADYVRYEIIPPDELRASYDKLLAQKATAQLRENTNQLDLVRARFQKKITWWEKDFPKDTPALPKPVPVTGSGLAPAAAERGIAMPRVLSAPAPVAMNFTPPPEVSVVVAKSLAAQPTGSGTEAAIQLKKWEPDAAYYRRLQAAPIADMYRIYLDEKPSYLNSSAFYLDVADLFMERGQTDLGLRVLSNLAEMQLENRQVLRLLAYRLVQAKRPELAIPVLQTVLRLSPDEPQSYRDLGLALAAAGQSQAAIDQLWQVVSRPWHERFADIELIALAELNAILSQAGGQQLDTSRIDQGLLRNLPLDIRAVLSWDADNTDIDLWVTDPNGEKTYYGHPLSYQGGSLSRDFTGGYGPEEFSLKIAKPGTYRVETQYFGHNQQLIAGAITLMLRLSTKFGLPDQQDQYITVRLNKQKDKVLIGEFFIPERTPSATP
ncbi:VIT domain-containing protein [Undibacterium rugosum]|uniref:DUF2135 domain-containing protein n=1 Tax=Undibacterium rugosum TaxID=2762291 RepID=A0A923HXX7_9BURK|nr:VIT domain-containing protein [Undibacterium rugosum]MBC3934006.1 DUF2135 domain-containing protein [Undibacterium rugosum]MBR7777716.1 DUF2135 domain-containing protein [Undibacterium rugosum]